MSNISARKSSIRGPSPTPSDDSLSRFIQRSERVQSPSNSQKAILVMAGAKLAFLFIKVVKLSLTRAFMTWMHNASHVKTSIVCGGRILKGVHDRRSGEIGRGAKRRDNKEITSDADPNPNAPSQLPPPLPPHPPLTAKSLLVKFHTWKILSHLFRSDKSKLVSHRTTTLKIVLKRKHNSTIRNAFNSLRSFAVTYLTAELRHLNGEHSSLSADYARLLSDFVKVNTHSASLASRTLTAETNTINFNNKFRKASVEAGLVKLNTLLCAKTTLSLIWGKAQQNSNSLLSAFSGHPCAKLFRKWDILTRASSWAENAQSNGLSENLEWHQNRVENLTKQMVALQTQADERKWSVDVMAKQVVRGAEENANMKLIINDLQEMLAGQQLVEKNLKSEVER